MGKRVLIVIILALGLTIPACASIQSADLKPWQEIIPDVIDASVMIHIKMPGEKVFDDEIPDELKDKKFLVSMGSGFVISPNGYVVTNFHVIYPQVADKDSEIWVHFSNNRSFLVTKTFSYPDLDLAILKINATNLAYVKLSEKAPVLGDPCITIGHTIPLDYNVSEGIVSHLSRDTEMPFNFKWMQTTILIYPGFSGGPVFNNEGDVIGINDAVYTRIAGFSLVIPVRYLIEAIKVRGLVADTSRTFEDIDPIIKNLLS